MTWASALPAPSVVLSGRLRSTIWPAMACVIQTFTPLPSAPPHEQRFLPAATARRCTKLDSPTPFCLPAFPGWDGRLPSSDGTIAEILRENGYNTFAVGKYGVTPDEEATDAGPFDHWPTGKGFDHFFGFLGSQTDQYKPDLVEDQAHVRPDGRHLSDQITDKAICYIDRQKKAAPRSPFSFITRPAPPMLRTRWTSTGATNTRGIRQGLGCLPRRGI